MSSAQSLGATPAGSAASLKQERGLAQRLKEITIEYVPLALITFGGPPAHIALLHDRFVVQRRWLSEELFVELFAIGSALPGPASTQLAYSVALMRDGVIPAIWSFCIWSLPGGIVMATLGTLIGGKSNSALPEGVLYLSSGLASAAVALIALAAYKLGNKLCKTPMTKIIAAISASLTMNYTDEAWLIPCVMVFGGVVAYAVHLLKVHKAKLEATRSAKKNDKTNSNGTNGFHATVADEAQLGHNNSNTNQMNGDAPSASVGVSPPLVNNGTSTESIEEQKKHDKAGYELDESVALSFGWRTGVYILGIWIILFIGSILLRQYAKSRALQVLGVFYYVGVIIFGGGPVVIPLLYQYIVVPGWAESSAFLLGLAIINSMPGPNFNFAAFCGALSMRKYGVGHAFGGAVLAWIGIFLPGILTITGVLPLWHKYRGFPSMKIAFEGVNAAAVGLVFTAVYLLWQTTLSINNGVRGTTSVGDNPLYVAIVGCSFIAVGMFNVPAPVAITCGGCIGLLDWAAASS